MHMKKIKFKNWVLYIGFVERRVGISFNFFWEILPPHQFRSIECFFLIWGFELIRERRST